MQRARAARNRLSQPVKGPGDKVYFVSQHRDKIGYAKPFVQRVYKQAKDKTETGMFVKPGAKSVIVVDPSNTGAWRYPSNDDERARAAALLKTFKDKHGEHATPQQHYAMLSKKKRNKQQPKPAPPPKQQQQPRPAPPPAQSQAQREHALLKKHHVAINWQTYELVKTQFLIKRCYEYLVKIAKILDKTPLTFPSENEIKAFNFDAFVGILRRFEQVGTRSFNDANLPTDGSHWKFVRGAILASEGTIMESFQGTDRADMNMFADLTNQPDILQTHGRELHPVMINTMKRLFEKLLSHTTALIVIYNRALHALQEDARAANQADRITGRESNGDVRQAMSALVERSDEDTPALSGARARAEYFLALIKRHIPPTDERILPHEILYDLVKSDSISAEYFKYAMSLTDVFKSAVYAFKKDKPIFVESKMQQPKLRSFF